MQNVVDCVTERHLSFSSRARLASVEALCKQAIAQTGSGSVVEFGMALGGTGIILAEAATTSGRSFHGFDVFKMIPEPTSPKDDDKSRNRYRVIASGKAKGHSGGELYYGYRDDLEGEITASLAERGVVVDGRKVALHKGLIQDTWPPLSWLSVALAHVDCDWYDPVKCSLDHLAPRVVPGGIMTLARPSNGWTSTRRPLSAKREPYPAREAQFRTTMAAAPLRPALAKTPLAKSVGWSQPRCNINSERR